MVFHAFDQRLDDFGGYEFLERSALPQACNLFDQAARYVDEFLVGHQEDRFEFGIELSVGHHHREFAGDIGQRTHSSHHHFGTEFTNKIDCQAVKGFDRNIRQVLRDLLDESQSFLDFKERFFFLIHPDSDDQLLVQRA